MNSISAVITSPHRPTHRRPWWVVVAAVYVFLLLISTWIRTTKKPIALPEDLRMLEVHAISGERLLDSAVRFAYWDLGSGDNQHPPVMVLHGSPGQGRELAGLASGRVASLTLLSAIGVLEMELLGAYRVNHGLHGLQLAGLWLLREGLPYMGWMDSSMLGVPYARNLYDSDQRPLRQILAGYTGPMLIVHGRRDILVPVQAAFEHHRLVPQSELQLLDENHFAAFTNPAGLATILREFFARVDAGEAATRATAPPARVSASRLPFDPADLPQAMGVAAVVLFLFLAGSTFVSEDLTCIAAGVMVAQGRVGFLLAASACLVGIFVGDLLLFLLGRVLGRPALKRAPLKWFLRDSDVAVSSAWFANQGFKMIVASRFLPGARLPTYFAAGLLHTNFWKFAVYFLLAASVWTPALVGLSAGLGGEVMYSGLLQGRDLALKLGMTGVIVYLTIRLLLSISSHKGRRLLVSSWRRLTRWEFWPPWVFYAPVVCYMVRLALKHRSLTLFTAVNPAMPASGFIGESKSEILQGLSGAGDCIARYSVIEASGGLAVRFSKAKAFMLENRLSYPVVLKPDAGQRGSGVAVLRSDVELAERLRDFGVKFIIQEYAAGAEFGVFYYRYPNTSHGQIFSITEKRFPSVTGNGKSSLERLILDDPRAVCMAPFYLNHLKSRLWEVPEPGKSVQLVELGTHCRGAVFLDGSWVRTDALEAAIDRISKTYDGFYFGRYDIRTPSVEDFREGRNFKVVELNGVTSEATHIYDPKSSLVKAYQVLFAQWRIAFEIGAQNRRRCTKPTPLRTLAGLILDFKRRPRLNTT